jgi:uncharacterized protein (DUF4415 family)
MKTRPQGSDRKTRLAAASRRSDARIRAAAAADPDTFLPSRAELAAAELVVPPKKQQIALRVDPDVLAFYRRGGPGYQVRMHEALRAVMDAKTARTPGKPNKRAANAR